MQSKCSNSNNNKNELKSKCSNKNKNNRARGNLCFWLCNAQAKGEAREERVVIYNSQAMEPCCRCNALAGNRARGKGL